jgi:hypothetical protein
MTSRSPFAALIVMNRAATRDMTSAFGLSVLMEDMVW